MKKVILHFETLTPMFLGGADMKKPEIRTASIKGAMRFWWRAMNAHLVEKKNGKWDYSRLKEYENAIFGGTDSPKAQKSKVLLRIVNTKLSEPKNFKEIQDKTQETLPIYNEKQNRNENVNVIRYLGFGLYNFKNNAENRNFLEGTWDLQCEYPEEPITAKIKDKETKINIEKELQVAFSMLNLFGSLGSKARNGFGSVEITSKDFTLLDMNELQQYLQEQRKNATLNTDNSDGIVPYTAFSKLEIVQQGEIQKVVEGLEKIAQNYRNAKKQVKPDNEMIAAPEIPHINAERYPKRYWFSIKKAQNGTFRWQCLYLPVCIEFKSQKYKEQNKYFQNTLKSKKI